MDAENHSMNQGRTIRSDPGLLEEAVEKILTVRYLMKADRSDLRRSSEGMCRYIM
jgi:hypothetical protein